MLVAIIISALFFTATLYAIVPNALDKRKGLRSDVEGIVCAYIIALLLSIAVALLLPHAIVGFGSDNYTVTERQVTAFSTNAAGKITASTDDGGEYNLEQADVSLVMGGNTLPLLIEKRYFNPLLGATYHMVSVSNGVEEVGGDDVA